MPPEYSCPACSTSAGSGADLRTHLMIEHRKSELARLLVDDHSTRDREEDRLRV